MKSIKKVVFYVLLWSESGISYQALTVNNFKELKYNDLGGREGERSKMGTIFGG